MTAPAPRTITNDATRREFLGMLAAAGLLAACGDDGAASSDAAGDDTRTVSDVLGDVQVPTDPRRVVCMEQQTLGNLLAIGFPAARVVGFALASTPASDFPELAGLIDLEALDNVGDYAEPNAEALVAADPDLVLLVAEDGNDEFYGPILETLRSGGWAVFGAYNGYATVDDSMRLLADVGVAVGREDRAAQRAAGLRASIDQLATRLGATGGAPSTGFLRVFPGDGTLYNTVVPLLDALGVPGGRPTPEEFVLEISAEQLGRFDHEVLFVGDGGDERATRTALESNPLWATLPAVQGGRVVFVPDTLWGTSYSVLALELQLADIEQALLGAPAAT